MSTAAHFFLLEAERVALGTLLSHPNEALPWAAANMLPDDFSLRQNNVLFKRLLAMSVDGVAVNFATIASALRNAGEFEVCPPHFISDAAMAGTLPTFLPKIAGELREKRGLRLLRAGLVEAVELFNSPGANAADVTERVQAVIEAAAKARTSARPAPTMKELVMATVERIQRRHSGEKDEVGFPTGLTALDRETGGLRPGATWVIAGEAKGGKSTLAVNLLEALAIRHGQRCLFFGLEMPAIENVERMFASVGNVRAAAMRDGMLAEGDFHRITAVAGKLAAAPIMFRDDVFDLAEMMAVARQAKLAHSDLFAVFVDYAQLVGADRRDGDNREQEVAAVSVALRRLAMQEKLCVFVLSQLNDDGRLRESRKLGMDATTVVFIENDDEDGVKRLRLVQRGGRRVTIRVAYRGDFIRFDNLADGSEYAEDAAPKKEKKAWRSYHER